MDHCLKKKDYCSIQCKKNVKTHIIITLLQNIVKLTS